MWGPGWLARPLDQNASTAPGSVQQSRAPRVLKTEGKPGAIRDVTEGVEAVSEGTGSLGSWTRDGGQSRPARGKSQQLRTVRTMDSGLIWVLLHPCFPGQWAVPSASSLSGKDESE